ncbi:MAG: hypothetical protein FD174_200 [Geobacteraceae bacterium]|nr:MAG: hypothetical protein FD174_200 [Geobacteraceae bacterium]
MKFKKILEAAIQAPSGDNCQPWRFEVGDDEIRVFNLPEKDDSLFNYRQHASLVAHGALLENLLIAASAQGYKAETALFPDKAEPNHIATIRLKNDSPPDESLYPFISLRCTNRKRYDGAPLTDEQRSALLEMAESTGFGRLRLFEGMGKKALTRIIALNDRLVFENPNLHAFLFDHIRWNDREASKTRDGLDIKTLELASSDVVAFRLLKNWPLLKTLNIFGVSRIVAGNAKKLAMSASAVGMITVPGNSSEDFISGGRLMERVWLEATRLGISFQLMTGITCLMGKVMDGDFGGLSQEQVGLVKEAHDEIARLCRIKGETIVVMFRMGRSGPPTVRSLRVEIQYQEINDCTTRNDNKV